mgnify:CR=1 FL=1
MLRHRLVQRVFYEMSQVFFTAQLSFKFILEPFTDICRFAKLVIVTYSLDVLSIIVSYRLACRSKSCCGVLLAFLFHSLCVNLFNNMETTRETAAVSAFLRVVYLGAKLLI